MQHYLGGTGQHWRGEHGQRGMRCAGGGRQQGSCGRGLHPLPPACHLHLLSLCCSSRQGSLTLVTLLLRSPSFASCIQNERWSHKMSLCCSPGQAALVLVTLPLRLLSFVSCNETTNEPQDATTSNRPLGDCHCDSAISIPISYFKKKLQGELETAHQHIIHLKTIKWQTYMRRCQRISNWV